MAIARCALHRDGRRSVLSGLLQLYVRVWCVGAENQHHGHTAMPTRLASVDRAVNELRGIAMNDRHAHTAMSGCWLMGLGRASATPTRPVTNVNPSSHQLAAPDHEDKPARGHALVTWRDGPMRARPLLGCSEPPERPTRCGCPPARPLDQHISLGGDLVEHGGEAGGQAPRRRREHQKARPGLRAHGCRSAARSSVALSWSAPSGARQLHVGCAGASAAQRPPQRAAGGIPLPNLLTLPRRRVGPGLVGLALRVTQCF